MRLAEFILVATLVEITPGPNMAYLASLAAFHGWRAGIWAVAGILVGLSLYGVLAAFGLAALVAASPAIYSTLRFAGVAYMLWLACDSWPKGNALAGEEVSHFTARNVGWRGFLVSVLNPKAGVFYVAILPDFVAPDRGAPLLQNLSLVAVYVAIATTVHLAIVAVAGSLQTAHPLPASARPMLQRCFSVLLVAVAAWLAFATAR